MPHILLEAADEQLADVVLVEPLDVRDGGRLEQADEAGEGLGLAVVGRSGREDQRVAVAGQDACQGRSPGSTRAALGDVLALVDDDGVPVTVVQVLLVLLLLLQGVDGDNDLVEVVEGVLVRRDLRLDPLDAHRVEADQRDGEAGPELGLELGEDALEGDDQDALAAAAPDELREQDADLDGLAEADAVRHQDAGTELAQGLCGRVPLVGAAPHGGAVADDEAVVGGRRAAEQGFEVEAGLPVAVAVVADELGVLCLEDLHVVELGEEQGLLVADELRESDDVQRAAGSRVLHATDHPLLVADQDARSGREGLLSQHGQSRSIVRWVRPRRPATWLTTSASSSNPTMEEKSSSSSSSSTK